jgi:hypothetical protein
MNLLVFLLPLIIALTWVRLFRPGHQLEGTTLLVVPLPFLARLRMHLAPIVLSLIIGGMLVLLDLMPWFGLIAPLVSTALLLLIPVSYTLTDMGIRLGWTEFRRWTEFAGVRRAPGGARLLGVQRSRGLHIWLSGSRGDDEFLHFLRETVRNAYKGTRIMSFPARTQPVAPASESGSESPPAHIVAFSGEGHGTRDIS